MLNQDLIGSGSDSDERRIGGRRKGSAVNKGVKLRNNVAGNSYNSSQTSSQRQLFLKMGKKETLHILKQEDDANRL